MRQLAILIIAIMATQSSARTLPPADPDHALFQSSPDWILRAYPGGREVAWPEPDKATIEEMRAELEIEQTRADAETVRAMAAEGRVWLSWGTGLLVAGIVLALVLRQYGAQIFGTLLAGAGLSAAGKGVIDIKIAANWTVFSWCVVAAVVTIISIYVCREFGIDLTLKKGSRDDEKQ